jgi:hypothetical protein
VARPGAQGAGSYGMPVRGRRHPDSTGGSGCPGPRIQQAGGEHAYLLADFAGSVRAIIGAPEGVAGER